MLTSRNGLVCTTTPGCGRSASTRIEPASTDSGEKRSRSTPMWSSPLSSGSTTPGSILASASRLSGAGLGRNEQRVDRLLQSRQRARACHEVAERHALYMQALARDHRRGALARDHHDVTTIALEQPREQAAHSSGPEDGDPHALGSISTPGFMMPAGSTASFAPRSAAANGCGR